MRWREPVRDRRHHVWLLVAVVFLHVLFAVLTWHEMQSRATREIVPVSRGGALQVRLIPVSPVQPAPPLPALPPAQSLTPSWQPVVHEPPSRHALTVALSPQAPAAATSVPHRPALMLYDKTGQPILAPAPASTASAPDYIQSAPKGDTRVMEHPNPLRQPATRFEAAFPPPNENAKDTLKRKVVEKLTKPHAVRLPGGIHLTCRWLTGCQDPPAPPSAKGGDVRLNMAPANPLTSTPATPKVPSERECIDIYRAGKPLPYGCPVDTPNRAVDEELRERKEKNTVPDPGAP